MKKLPLGVRVHYWRGWRGTTEMPIKNMPFVNLFVYKLARRYALRIGGLVMSCPMRKEISTPRPPAQEADHA